MNAPAVAIVAHSDRVPAVDPVRATIARVASIHFANRPEPLVLSEGAAARFRQIAFTVVWRGYQPCVNECNRFLDRAESELVAGGLIEVGQRWPIPLDGPWAARTVRLTAAGYVSAHLVCGSERADRLLTMTANDYAEWFHLASCDLRNRDERRIPAVFVTPARVTITEGFDHEGAYVAAIVGGAA